LPIAVHLRDTLLFAYYIVRAMGDVPFGFIEATELHRAIHRATYNKDQDTAQLEARSSGLLLNADIALYFLRRRGAMKGAAAKGTLIRSPRPAGQQCGGIRPFLFLFVGSEGWLPRCGFSAWRRGNCLDLLFLWFLGFSIASLLAFCHVDLLGVC
jgi:hypothetical protein